MENYIISAAYLEYLGFNLNCNINSNFCLHSTIKKMSSMFLIGNTDISSYPIFSLRLYSDDCVPKRICVSR